jgi:hypothetical protein
MFCMPSHRGRDVISGSPLNVGSGHGFDNARDVSAFVQKDDGRCDIGLPAADCQVGRPPLPGHLNMMRMYRHIIRTEPIRSWMQ